MIHSEIIGISLGASERASTIKPLVAALSFHQFFEGTGLGGCISQVYTDAIHPTSSNPLHIICLLIIIKHMSLLRLIWYYQIPSQDFTPHIIVNCKLAFINYLERRQSSITRPSQSWCDSSLLLQWALEYQKSTIKVVQRLSLCKAFSIQHRLGSWLTCGSSCGWLYES